MNSPIIIFQYAQFGLLTQTPVVYNMGTSYAKEPVVKWIIRCKQEYLDSRFGTKNPIVNTTGSINGLE